MMMRITIVQPATATLPNDAMIRTTPTQLVVPMSIWNTALPDRRTMFSITAGSSRRCRRRMAIRPSPRDRK